MVYRMLADLTLLLHLGFILFVAAGAVLVLRWPRLAFAHVPCAVWGIYTALTGTICPLTPLEVHLRRLGGQAGYEGGFIQHYVERLVYPPGITAGQLALLGGAALAVNIAVYAALIRRRRRVAGGAGGRAGRWTGE
jgi:hypothetical protein